MSALREAEQERDAAIAGMCRIAEGQRLPSKLLTILKQDISQACHDAWHDEIDALEQNAETRASCIYHRELAADIRDHEGRVL